MASEPETEQLRVFFLPYPIAGHMIPMVDAARLFASHRDQGVAVTVITTAANGLIFQNSIDRHIRIYTLQFPSSEVGLPDGVENLNSATSAETFAAISAAIGKLREPFQKLLREERPDCIVTDMLQPWTADVAAELGIPRIFFNGGGYFADCAGRSVQVKRTCSDDDVVFLSGLPDMIELLRTQVPDWTIVPNFAAFLEAMAESERKSYGALMNSFDELEPAYVEHFKKTTTMKKAWSVGPVSLWLNLIDKDHHDLSKRGKIVNYDQEYETRDILNWLNSKQDNSVVYISFGSLTRFSSTQHKEISQALEASGYPFIWVVRKKETDEYSEIFHEGFEQRMKDNKRGLVVRDWAPQTLILDHPATGAMVTHCGWNSIMEAVAAGKPMITWPLFAEQFYNEKLVTEVLRVGVGVGVKEWSVDCWRLGKEVVGRDKVEKGVELLMGGGEEAAGMRKRVRKLAEDAKKAVESGGSSQSNLTALINELKSLKKSSVQGFSS